MISAEDARALRGSRLRNKVAEFLNDKVDPMVQSQAADDRITAIIITPTGGRPSYATSDPDNFEVAVIDRLSELGYTVEFSKIKENSKNNEKGEPISEYGFIITW